MKLIRYSLILGLCTLVITVTGCTQKSAVVNTNSGIVIKSNDFTGGFKQRAAESDRIRQVSAPTAKSTGNVIHLGDGYEKIEMGPLFDAADKM